MFIVLFLGACSSKESTLNVPLSSNKPIPILKPLKNKENTSLFLTFSGGGTRAAALSYGVLKGLNKYNLLDNIEIISSVSGGSFTAAYFGLYGDKIFEDFESKFLKKPIQTRIIDTILNPLNWFNYSLYNRSDYVANFYDKEIFGKKTFGHLRKHPQIIINATDISTGNAFSFTKENFAKICSDLNSYSIGKAVTASSAVPGVFSPLTLKNYDMCKKTTIKNTNKGFLKYNHKQTKNINKLQNTKKYPYLHLVDGGISDNLGLRALFDIVAKYDNDFIKLMKAYGMEKSNKIAILVVNAADSLDPNIAINKQNPSITEVISATSTIQLTRYNHDTLDILDYYISLWKKQAQKFKIKNLKFYVIELNFNNLPKKRANLLSRTKTSLELDAKRVDEIIKAGEELLDNSNEFQQFLKDFKSKKRNKNGILEQHIY